MRVIITKSSLGEVIADLPVIHAPVLKVDAVDSDDIIDSTWIVFTSVNAIENITIIPEKKIACMPSCVTALDKRGIAPHLVFENLESKYITETLNNILAEHTVTYLSGDKTALDLDGLKNKNNFKRIVVYRTTVNEEQDFSPIEGDHVVFWSGFAVKAAQKLGWTLENCEIFACSESASKALTQEHTRLNSYRTEDVLSEIAGFLRV